MKSFRPLLAACFLLAGPAISNASDGHAEMDHSAMMQHGTPALNMGPSVTEGGQAAFAAIQEIVSVLLADPQTDWDKVNIEALRQHLIDMDNVTLRAKVAAEMFAHHAHMAFGWETLAVK